MELDGGMGDLTAMVEEMARSAAQEAAEAYSAKLAGRENEVPMVSMDGEAHPNMTLAAIGLGVFVALIILLTLIAFISRRERSSNTKEALHQRHDDSAQPRPPIETISRKLSAPVRCVSFASDVELSDVTVTRM